MFGLVRFPVKMEKVSYPIEHVISSLVQHLSSGFCPRYNERITKSRKIVKSDLLTSDLLRREVR
jgi:hypothetical protein